MVAGAPVVQDTNAARGFRRRNTPPRKQRMLPSIAWQSLYSGQSTSRTIRVIDTSSKAILSFDPIEALASSFSRTWLRDPWVRSWASRTHPRNRLKRILGLAFRANHKRDQFPLRLHRILIPLSWSQVHIEK
jgi:hypothetical protein